MKRILIAGEGSYIGTHLLGYLARFPERYEAKELPMQGRDPGEFDFRGADAIVHVAAIVHRKETKALLPLYTAVNRDLAVAVAEKAKREGVRQFIFFSSMSVYGMDEGTITRDTVPNPVTAYGKTKLEAERRIAALADDAFAVTILRPPMVFGAGAKGNPARLDRIAKRLPVCPDFENRRSMVSIDTLCMRLQAYIDAPRSGIFFPQEDEPVRTGELIARMMREQGRTPKSSKLLNPAIRVLRACTRAGKKAFGDLVYEDLDELPLPAAKDAREGVAHPRVSVIMPAFRCEKTVEKSVRSALAQTERDFELIIADDASDDGTPAILARLRKEDPRIRVITLPKNKGVANARNRAVEASQANWLAFLDSDDIWSPDKLERQLRLAEETGATLVYTAAECIDENDRKTGKVFSVPPTITADELLRSTDLVTSTVLVRWALYAAHPMERGDLHEDLICWYRILKDGAKAVGIGDPLLRYRVFSGSKSGNKWRSGWMAWRTYRYLKLGFFKECRSFLGYCLHGIKRYWL